MTEEIRGIQILDSTVDLDKLSEEVIRGAPVIHSGNVIIVQDYQSIPLIIVAASGQQADYLQILDYNYNTLYKFGPDWVHFNEQQNDVDFRVASVGKENAFFVRGSDGNVGINKSGSSMTFHVVAGAGGVTQVAIGENDDEYGLLHLYGGGGGNEGGEIRLYTNSDWDSTIQYWYIDAQKEFLRLGTSVTSEIFFTKDGEMGFGTNAPAGMLDIRTKDATTRGIFVKGFAGQSSNLLECQQSDSNVVYIVTAAGDFGIGTGSPTEALDINSDAFRLRTDQTPPSGGAIGNKGTYTWDSSYIYVCVDTNTWKRATLADGW